MDDVLRDILARAELKGTPTFTHDEARRWPDGALDTLVELGVLREIDRTEGVWIDCNDSCFVRPDLREHPETGEMVAVHNCRRPGCGRLEIPVDQLRRWQADFVATAKAVKAAAGAKGPFVEAARDRLWRLGHVVRDGARLDIYLGRGLDWLDAGTIVSAADSLRTADSPVILTWSRPPGPIEWPRRRPRFMTLAALVEVRGGKLHVDQQLLFAKSVTTGGSGVMITVTDGAHLLSDVVDNLTLERSRARVSKAAGDGKFKTNGKTGAARRIDRDSFNTWRFEQRDRDLARVDG